jgi:3-oxoacyl-[acyl-carrier protein] reductase
MRLGGRVALVTGGSRGIGRALAIGLAREGARVAVNYHAAADAAARVVAEIEAAGGTAIALRADVSDAADVDAMVAAAAERFGGLDILVNNAALTDVHRPWQAITEADWDRVQDVNLKGCFLCFRAAYPYLRASGHGRVVNISSVTFWAGSDRLAHYVASKGGVIGFTRAISREVGAEGITVNAVTPGAIQTESEIEMFPDQAAIAVDMARLQSIPRRGQPEDIVGAVVFLASDEASFVTGQTINVDGGCALH